MDEWVIETLMLAQSLDINCYKEPKDYIHTVHIYIYQIGMAYIHI